jgi:formylglycine-generating enzyme required for sulfatase activity
VPKIAISYRRADTEVMTGRIRDRLVARYGDDAVFMDIDNIPFGKDFRVHIREVIVQSDILLVIVGPRWLGASRGGNRRIDNETDFVRLEVETALSNGIPIIPLLVGSARMPQPALVPESLKQFAFLNAASVATGRDFHQHMERLIRGIDQIPDLRATTPANTWSRDEVALTAKPAGSNADAQSRSNRTLAPPAFDVALPGASLTLRSASQGSNADRADLEVFRDASFAPELVVIPTGEFMMGSTEEEEVFEDERPQHRVTIHRRFALGRYPVTFEEYNRFCEATRREKPADQGWGRARRPVILVSWDEAQAYNGWLSQETGKAYRLPSEAEWEYACRAGTTTRYSFGDAITPRDANYGDTGLKSTSEVGGYPPNPWGFHDMHGNVWEWVEDDWHENYREAPTDGSAWKEPEASSDQRLCVLRGGSWDSDSRGGRSAFRNRRIPNLRRSIVGFRVARTLS